MKGRGYIEETRHATRGRRWHKELLETKEEREEERHKGERKNRRRTQ